MKSLLILNLIWKIVSFPFRVMVKAYLVRVIINCLMNYQFHNSFRISFWECVQVVLIAWASALIINMYWNVRENVLDYYAEKYGAEEEEVSEDGVENVVHDKVSGATFFTKDEEEFMELGGMLHRKLGNRYFRMKDQPLSA